MKVILEWDGNREDLMDEEDNKYGEDMTLQDSIMWVLDYANYGDSILHNNIKIRKERK